MYSQFTTNLNKNDKGIEWIVTQPWCTFQRLLILRVDSRANSRGFNKNKSGQDDES